MAGTLVLAGFLLICVGDTRALAAKAEPTLQAESGLHCADHDWMQQVLGSAPQSGIQSRQSAGADGEWVGS